MPSLFPRWSTAAARLALIAVIAVALAVPLFLMGWVRTPYARGEHVRVAQPIAFDHRIHVTGLRIDCRYCHAGADRTAYAGLPSTQTCVPCHEQVWLDGPAFAPVRASLASGKPIPWKRVTWLPDFVFFDHEVHVRKGVGCESCHGRVDRMASAEQVVPLTMTWCLDCHRAPEKHLRPASAVTALGYVPAEPQARRGARLAREYHVRRLTDCTTCHR